MDALLKRFSGAATLPAGRAAAAHRPLFAFVFLVANRSRPVGRDELVDVIWPEQPPPEVDAALSAILSKLRAVLKRLGSDPEASIDVGSGSAIFNTSRLLLIMVSTFDIILD